MNEKNVITLRGMTWDDPRGTGPLPGIDRAFSETPQGRHVRIEWDVQPLSGFESHPLDDLARRYDLLIMDHPHCGQAARAGCLRPVGDVPDEYVGLSRESYLLHGKYWARPLDAASQIAAYHPSRMASPPMTWDEVWSLADRGARVATPLVGVHALMALGGILASLGHPLDWEHGWPEIELLSEACQMLRRLARTGPAGALDWNPIDAFGELAAGRIDYVPLTFGYEHFSSAGVRFASIPSYDLHRPARAILGGAGLAVSAYCLHPDAADAFAQFATSACVQSTFGAEHGGQPAHRRAWDTLARTRAFYRDARSQMDSAYLRPRACGWNRFQLQAGNEINRWLKQPDRSVALLNEIVRPIWDQLQGHT